jgi:phosphomevalonate kinase
VSEALKSLVLLDREVKDIRLKHISLVKASEALKRVRNHPHSLCQVINEAGKYNALLTSERAIECLKQVINERKHDLIRLAELRLEADARALKIEADQKQAVVDAAILPGAVGQSQLDHAHGAGVGSGQTGGAL